MSRNVGLRLIWKSLRISKKLKTYTFGIFKRHAREKKWGGRNKISIFIGLYSLGKSAAIWNIELYWTKWSCSYTFFALDDIRMTLDNLFLDRESITRYYVLHYKLQGGKPNFAGWGFRVFLQHGSRYQSKNWHRWSSGLIVSYHKSKKTLTQLQSQ